MRYRFLLAGLVLGLAAGSLRADARADFMQALELQKAQKWGEAAQNYMKVTAQLPKYAPAWKQLATCRYYMGDYEGSVASTDRYLALQPSDTAFAKWSDGVRAKLKLPPRELPAAPVVAMPVPAAVPVAAPVDTVGMAAIPPPSADAKVVAPENASVLNAQAAENAVALEQKADQSAEEQMIAEAAAVKASRPDAPRGKLHLGLRLLGGYSLGLGSFSHGEDVNDAMTPSGNRYAGHPAEGAAGAAELLLAVRPQWDASLGLYPLVWGETRKSSVTTSVTRSNSSDASALFMPIMVGASWHPRLAKGLQAVASLGVGAVPGARVTVKSQTVQTFPAGLNTTTATATYDYALAPAWRAALGAEWAASPSLGLHLGVQVLGASFSDMGGNADVDVVDETGTTLLRAKGVAVPAQSLQLLSTAFLGGLSVRF
jgi:hypothetical protein